MKYYIDENGNYLIATDGLAPVGGIEVPYPPDDARQPWLGDSWGPIPVEVPASITRRQGRLTLLDAELLDDLEQAIEAMEDPKEKRMAQIEYQCETWERSNPWVEQMGVAMGLTAEQIDELFILASSL